MTVKELEERTGLSRANIRFYEQEALLTPSRLPNGYRNYSAADLAALLRIKLLRQLEVPLEDIRSLIREEAPLGDLMDRHAALLAQEGLRLAAAWEVCDEIRRSGLTYAGLDPDPYLRRLAQTGAPRQSGPAADCSEPCPWRRYFARYLDLSLCSTVYQLILILAFRRRDITGLGWEILVAVLGMVTMLFVEPLLLSRWGTTPGKWVLGLRVESGGGGRITYDAALGRTFDVITQGMGLQIPLYSLLKLYHSYRGCVDEGLLPWEAEGGVVVAKGQRPRQVAGFLALHAGRMILLAAAMLSLMLPPHRGALTAEEYVKNFNYYMAWGQHHYRLTEEGALVLGPEEPNTVYIMMDRDLTDLLRFTFTEEGGMLKAVTAEYSCRYDGEEGRSVDEVRLPSWIFKYVFLSAAGADASLPRILSLFRTAETLCAEQGQVTCRDLTASFTVEQSGYTAYDGTSIYIALSPDETCWVRARLTLELP